VEGANGRTWSASTLTTLPSRWSRPLDQQHRRVADLLAVAPPDARPDDDVRQPPLFLQAEEQDAVGGCGGLAADHQPGHPYPLPVPTPDESMRGGDMQELPLPPVERDHVPIQAHAQEGVVQVGLFRLGGLWQRDRRLRHLHWQGRLAGPAAGER